MIKIEALTKYYGSQKVLHELNLQFEDGKVIGIVGENGAGKSTLFRCIAGLEKHQGLVSSSEEVLKNHLGFLPTIPYFFSRITGKEYIQLVCNARKVKVANFDDANVFDLPLNKYAMSYSTGMKKKLALTAILLQNNKYFILDEPFNGVDIQSNLIIAEIILRLKALGKTILISSHIFSTLSETCDEIYLLREGRIIKKVGQQGFKSLEKEMKQSTIGDKVSRLNLK